MLKLLLATATTFVCLFCSAQSVGVGTTTPNASAQLDVSSSTKGFLPPRLTTAERKAIASPAAGLVVFDKDMAQLYLFDGTVWQPLSSGSSTNMNTTPSQQTQPVAEQKVTGYFGIDVAMSDSFAVVGAPKANAGATSNAGTALVYKKNASGTWLPVVTLQASDAQANALFGMSVATAGNYIVVGSPGFTISGKNNAGKVYVFVKGAGDTWSQQASFTKPGTPATGEYYGYNVAISITSTFGPAFIVGAPYVAVGGYYAGAAYTYRYSANAWAYEQTIAPNFIAAGDHFGSDVDIDGDYFAVSSPEADNTTYNYNEAGHVYIYVYGGGVWNFQQDLAGKVENAAFGTGVSLKGNVLAVGAPKDSDIGNGSPRVYVYTRSGTVWANEKKLYLLNMPEFYPPSYFGYSVCLDGDKLLVSVPGAYVAHFGGAATTYGKHGYVFVYQKGADGEYYIIKAINDSEPFNFNGNTDFGNAVAMKNGNYVIGIPGKTVGTIKNAGSVAFGFIE